MTITLKTRSKGNLTFFSRGMFRSKIYVDWDGDSPGHQGKVIYEGGVFFWVSFSISWDRPNGLKKDM